MSALMRFVEAALLVAMGTFMAVLSQSSVYWQFINPKYSWLTFVSGVILTVVGFGCLLNTQRKRNITEFIGILVFLGLAATGITSFEHAEYEYEEPIAAGSLTRDYDDIYAGAGASSVTIDGEEFVKINVAELLDGEAQGLMKAGSRYAIQGAVLRTPELDAAGYIGVGRLFITCCFADSTGVVALVKVANPDAHVAGSWVRAAGVLEEGSPFSGSTLSVKGALTAAWSERFILRAVEVEERGVEGLPFIFQVKLNPPYAF